MRIDELAEEIKKYYKAALVLQLKKQMSWIYNLWCEKCNAKGAIGFDIADGETRYLCQECAVQEGHLW